MSSEGKKNQKEVVKWEPVKETLSANRAQIDELKAKLVEKHGDDYIEESMDDVYLYRFLKGYAFVMDEAFEAASATVAWRKEAGMEKVRKVAGDMQQKDFPNASELLKCYPHNINHGHDKQGQPLSIECIGKTNPGVLCRLISLDQLMDYHIHHTEHKMLLAEKLTRENGKIYRFAKILDLDGLGAKHLNREGLRYFKSVLSCAQDNYPEMAGSVYVVNAPWVFNAIWKIVKPWLKPATLDKITILGHNCKDTLLKDFDADQLPTFLGGTCECEGGCVPEVDPDQGMTKVDIGGRNKHVVEHDLEAGTGANWEFRTLKNNVEFAVQFVPSKGEAVEVVKQGKVESQAHQIRGDYQTDVAGKLILTFDNSYSRWTGKTVVFRVDVQKKDKKAAAPAVHEV